MPSPRHDAVNQLFRDRPELAVEILRELAGLDVPAAAPVRAESNDFNDRPSKDFQPDTVITVGPPQSPVHGIVVEVQQGKAAGKRKQLPRYAAALWLFLRCPVTVLCVCPESEAAAYYAKPIETELPGYVFRAVVLGPGDVPAITDADEATNDPELAVLAVMMHGYRRPVAEAFVAALDQLKPDYAPQYLEYAYSMAAPAVRLILEELVSSSPWLVVSPFAREHFGRGKAEGRAEGEADSILKVLAARGIDVPDSTCAYIHACLDTEQLDVWLDRAVTATSIDDLFD
jgi:hypothetical protein